MPCTFQHPPGAEARSFIASREVTLDPGASAGTPAGDQGPGRSLPGPGRGAIPCKVRADTGQATRAHRQGHLEAPGRQGRLGLEGPGPAGPHHLVESRRHRRVLLGAPPSTEERQVACQADC